MIKPKTQPPRIKPDAIISMSSSIQYVASIYASVADPITERYTLFKAGMEYSDP